MTTFKDDLLNQRDDLIVSRNKLARQLGELLRAKAILEKGIAEHDGQVYALDCAIDPESKEQEAFKRGFQSAEAMQLEKQAAAQRGMAAAGPAPVSPGFPPGFSDARDELAKALNTIRTRDTNDQV